MRRRLVRRGDVDDPAIPLRLHQWDSSTHRMKGTREVNCDDLIPLLDRKTLDLLDMLDAGIVDQHVHRLKGLCGGWRTLLQLLGRFR